MNFIMRRFKSDSGDGVLVFIIFLIPVLVLLLGFGIDVTNNVHNKNELNAIAQSAVESGVRAIDVKGNLNNLSGEQFLSTYRKQLADATITTNPTCNKMEVDGVMRNLPFYKLSIEGKRQKDGSSGKLTWVSGSSAAVRFVGNSEGYDPKVLSAEVYVGTANVFGIVGLPQCQLHKSTVSAIVFGSQGDI